MKGVDEPVASLPVTDVKVNLVPRSSYSQSQLHMQSSPVRRGGEGSPVVATMLLKFSYKRSLSLPPTPYYFLTHSHLHAPYADAAHARRTVQTGVLWRAAAGCAKCVV